MRQTDVRTWEVSTNPNSSARRTRFPRMGSRTTRLSTAFSGSCWCVARRVQRQHPEQRSKQTSTQFIDQPAKELLDYWHESGRDAWRERCRYEGNHLQTCNGSTPAARSTSAVTAGAMEICTLSSPTLGLPPLCRPPGSVVWCTENDGTALLRGTHAHRREAQSAN